MGEILKVGLIGAGARGYYTPFWMKHNKKSKIIAIADLDPGNVEKTLKEINNKVFVTDNYKEVLAMKEVDAVIIMTPDHLHEEQTIAALEAGKHVFLDKPMATTIEGCNRIEQTLSKTDKKIMIGFNMRFMSMYQTMKKIIEDGKIGDVKSIWVRHFVGRGGRFYYQDWHRNSRYTNSLLVQKGSHDIDMIHMLGNSYTKKISAFGSLDFYNQSKFFEADGLEHQTTEEMDVEDNNVVIMELNNGIKAAYLQNHFTPDYSRNYTVIGTKGRLESDDINNTINVYSRKGQHIESSSHQEYKIKSEDLIYHDGSDFKIWDSFINYIINSVKPPVSMLDGKMSVVAAIKATESMRDNGNLKYL